MYDSIVKTCVVFFVSLCFVTSPSAHGRVIYVDDDAVGPGDGSSWADAYRFLQDALANANDSAKPVEIRVAQGIYRPDQRAGQAPGDREATFQLLNGVTLQGGYAGLGGMNPNGWDPTFFRTILNGDLQGNDDFQERATLHDNSQHVVTSLGVDDTAVLEGVTVAHGAHFGVVSRVAVIPPEGGAGLYNESSSPLIKRCVFLRNFNNTGYGSAVLNYGGGTPRFEECTFEENYHVVALVDHESHSILHNCRFIKNHSKGIWQIAGTSEIDDCQFVENGSTAVALDNGSRSKISNCAFIANVRAIGGAQVECRNCTFERNTSKGDSGAVRIDRGSFVDCIFRGNSADIGGAITAVSLELQRCVFVLNSAREEGAVTCTEGEIQQCLFAGNQAAQGIGALRIRRGATISNCTFVGNRSAFDGTIYVSGAQQPVAMTNCIFRDNTCFDINYWPSSRIAARYSSVSDASDQWQTTGKAVIDVDPAFVDPGSWDPNGTPDDPNDDFFVEGDYHLKSQAGRWDAVSGSWIKDEVTSPCIDAEDPMSAIGHEPFPNGGRINMGAYGGTAEASKSYFGEPVCETVIAGDINGDCRVDFRDLQIMAGHWLEERGD